MAPPPSVCETIPKRTLPILRGTLSNTTGQNHLHHARGAPEARLARVSHQELLTSAMRETARWRRAKAVEFADDKIAAHRSNRTMVALSTSARFVDEMDADDRDLAWLQYVDADAKRLLLSEESWALLSRFGIDRGAWQDGHPTEVQIRKLLRRLSGAEARARGASRRDAS